MTQVFVTQIGISAERCPNIEQLETLINQEPATEPTRSSFYASPSIALGRGALAAIDREDRSTLGALATGTLNAIADAIGGIDAKALHEAMPVYAGNDSSEYSFTALCSLMQKHKGLEEVLRYIGEIRNYSNPLNMMRMLSTNPTYHTSKRLNAHGGGYPVRAMSLSGLCAFEDGWRAVANDRAPDGAVVVAAGNMRSFDALVAFGKMGLLRGMSGDAQVDPTYGAAALLLSGGPPATDAAPWAEVLDANSFFHPEPFAQTSTWSNMFEQTKKQNGIPDVIVAYRNGAHLLNEAENQALAIHYPDVSVRSYKNRLGYTGKPNNLLDLAAVLVDHTVPDGAVVMINGTGFGWGVGNITIRKLGRPTLH